MGFFCRGFGGLIQGLKCQDEGSHPAVWHAHALQCLDLTGIQRGCQILPTSKEGQLGLLQEPEEILCLGG